jgi:MFS family permease
VGLQYTQLVLGYSPLHSAVALVPATLFSVPASQATPRLVRRFGTRAVLVGGLSLLGTGLVVLALLRAGSGYPPFLVGLIPAGAGIGKTGAAGTAAITDSLTRDQQGVASAVNDVTREMGAAVGIALMGSLFSSGYRHALPAVVGRLPAAAAVAVRDSPAAGLHVAGRIGAPGPALAADVKAAFMSGMSAALGTVAIVVACAIGFLLMVRRRPDVRVGESA